MIKKTILSSLILIIFYSASFSQNENGGIKWKSIEEAFELTKKEPRPIIIDVYTDWCTWCKHMDKTTFSNLGIIKYINTNFYAVKFNAETLEKITFKGKKYANRRIGRSPTHDLAAKLLDGKLSYPSIVFFSRDGKKVISSGYKEPKDIEGLLAFFAEDIGKTASMRNFMINYMYAFPHEFKKDHSIFIKDKSLQKPDTLGKVKWIEPASVMKESLKVKKPIMVYLYTDSCIGCKVMNRTSFGNRKLAKQINQNYYSVKVDVSEEKEFSFLGSTYKGASKNQLHEIATKYLENYDMPAILFFDKDYKFISRVNGYLLTEHLLPLTNFFYKKKYLKMTFEDYLKDYKK